MLVDDRDTPVGSASVYKEWSDWNAGFYWWIQSMYLEGGYRKRGLVPVLIDEILKEMKQQHGLELRLYVHENNVAAKKAYAKVGFNRSEYEIMILG